MASEKSAFATLYDAGTAGTRIGPPNLDTVVHHLEQRVETITITEAANAAGDHYDLGPVLFDNLTVIPELCFVRYPTGSTGTLTDVVLTLAKVDTDGTVVDLTGPVTASGAVGEAFTDFAAATTLPTCSSTDRFRLRITSITTLTAGRTMQIEIGYRRQNG